MGAARTVEIAIMGAGLVGCYVGGALAAAGAKVRLIGRPSFIDEIAAGGLRVTDADGRDQALAAADLTLSLLPDAAAGCDAVLVTVKSDATGDAGCALRPFVTPGTPVLSLQNGVDNAAALTKALPAARVVAGMVPFNVVRRGPGHVHRATGGSIHAGAEAAIDTLAASFAAAGLPLRRCTDMRAVLWGKLLVNLNNAVNALSGKPLADELADRNYRRALALSMAEGLRHLKTAGIRPASVLPFPIARMPLLLSLPDFLYRPIMDRRGTKVDSHARGSMADDLARGRRTEVDHLNGAIVCLAETLGRTAPVNARVVELVRAAERGAEPWPGIRLRQELAAAVSA